MHNDHVGLENGELVLGYFADVQEFIFFLDDVTVTDLLVDDSGGLVHQLYIIILINYDYCVEVGEEFEVCDEFVGCKCPYFRRDSTPVY